MFTQQEYTISERHYEYSRILSTIKVRLEEIKQEGLDTSYLQSVYDDLKDNGGVGIAPNHYDTILLLLLEYVPEEIKEKY